MGLNFLTDRHGVRGRIAESSGANEAEVHLENGEVIRVARDRLTPRSGGGLSYDGALDNPARPEKENGRRVEERTIPLAEEVVTVKRVKHETGRILIHKHVYERSETVDEPVFDEEVNVRRVPVNRVVDEPVPVRRDGEATIVPVFEERLVVNRQLVLKEELHITKRKHETRVTEQVALKSEDVSVERQPAVKAEASHPPSTAPHHMDRRE